MTLYIRKIAAAAGFATGAALAFAPLAAATPDPTLVSSTLDSEISSQNSLFDTYAFFAGDTVTKAVAPGGYDSVPVADVPHALTYGAVTPLETELYGVNPIVAGISSGVSGPFEEYNGALTEFDDAYNVAAFAAANNGALDTNVNDYLGSATTIAHAVSGQGATVASAEQFFLNFGSGDLKGFFGDFAPAASGPGDIDPIISGEIGDLNNLFELDGHLAGAYGDIAPEASKTFGVGFDTISPTDFNPTFNSLVDGASGPSTDPGSYDVLNGALSEFYNAFNVEDYSLLNAGALLPSADIFGTHAELATVAASVSEYLTLGTSDLAGFF
jgi:hypothetical protein